MLKQKVVFLQFGKSGSREAKQPVQSHMASMSDTAKTSLRVPQLNLWPPPQLFRM